MNKIMGVLAIKQKRLDIFNNKFWLQGTKTKLFQVHKLIIMTILYSPNIKKTGHNVVLIIKINFLVKILKFQEDK